MLSGNLRNCLVVAVTLVGMATFPIGVIAGEWKPPKEFAEVSIRIEDLGKITNLSAVEKQKRLEQLEALGREIEQKWREADVETYARLTYEVCATMGSLDFGTRKNYYLARSFAMRALEKADEFPLEVECKLLGYVPSRFDANGNMLEGEAWAALRKRQVTLWLHAWQRIEKTIDKDWDPNERRFVNVMPPPGVPGPPGMDPKHIKDPKLRAEYEAAIEANRQKIAKAILQFQVRDLMKYWIPGAERVIIWAYMEPPTGKAELKELEALLQKHVSDAGKRARILEAVEKKQMPDDLIPRIITTQPDEPKPTTQPAEGKSTTQPSEAK